MTLLTLQKELCSSPQPAAQTLEKMLARQPDPELARYLTLAQSIPYGRKVDAARNRAFRRFRRGSVATHG